MAAADFYRPAECSEELTYLRQRREALGGYLPSQEILPSNFNPPDSTIFEIFDASSDTRALSTTTAMVRLLTKLLKDLEVGPLIVPIVPDEARTFGMNAMFKVAGIYSPDRQRYTPVYVEALNGCREGLQGRFCRRASARLGALPRSSLRVRLTPHSAYALFRFISSIRCLVFSRLAT